MHALYNLSISLFTAAIHVAAIFSPKAKKWVNGRKAWREKLSQSLQQTDMAQTLWMHVASLGEFEQGRPLIEQFRAAYPDWRIVLSFYSPSGYEIRKDYALADVVTYLPADSPGNVRDFLELVQPTVAIFVKYDLWANYLFQLKKRDTPTLLISALFRPSQAFFKWYGGIWREMLDCFSHIFVQNEASAILLQQLGIKQISIAGDTRVDRVLRIAAEVKPNPIVAAFSGTAPVFVAGSTWEVDENIIKAVLQRTEFEHFNLIIAPHEPSQRNVARICAQFDQAIPYSRFETGNATDFRVLVIDNIGMLNTLYRYGRIAYIGGGFGKGIHNTLEPAAFGLPIVFGPKYEKFEEARQFVARGGAFVVQDTAALQIVIQKLQVPDFHEKASKALLGYLADNKGATDLVMGWLLELFPAHLE